MSSFGDALARIRKSQKITQEKLSELSGVPRNTIAGLEAEKAQEPRWDTVVPLARALGVSLDQFAMDAAVATPPAIDRLATAEAQIAQLETDLLEAARTALEALELARELRDAGSKRRKKQAAS